MLPNSTLQASSNSAFSKPANGTNNTNNSPSSSQSTGNGKDGISFSVDSIMADTKKTSIVVVDQNDSSSEKDSCSPVPSLHSPVASPVSSHSFSVNGILAKPLKSESTTSPTLTPGVENKWPSAFPWLASTSPTFSPPQPSKYTFISSFNTRSS